MVDGVTDNGRNGPQYLGGFPVNQGKFRTRNGADILFRMPTYERKDIDPVNQRNLKALDNGGTAEFWMKGQICAIGAGHKSDLMADLKNGGFKGSIKITKGKLTDPGTLEVTGCKSQRREFEDGIHRFSKKKVIFK